ncbi:dual specificity protein phosphatase 26-like isoform X2 [Mastacembelus armatus]|uniref:dual specificity protein phosphatase 26-like isoform X2 n=1 Tax=Mastacembelus armatus TaxID=205130 RepID=UPI000E461912|nr:dual specificity protein phosphatase 26-like isoform X2 [Mastacembelus armatus]
MSYTTKLPPSWNYKSLSGKVEIDLSSPALAVFELERLLFTGKAILSHTDEVWPRLYIGDQHSAQNRADLSMHGITHILNAAHSKYRGTPDMYENMKITYMGIEAHDSCDFDMSVNFQAAADFIHRALSSGGGGRGRRESVGALSCRSEPLCHLGSGLPDAQAAPDSCGGYLCCER